MTGKTPLLKNEQISKIFQISNLLVKDESFNPTHLWKDRKSELVVNEALRGGFETVALVSNGNFGYSLAKFAKEKGLKSVIFVDGGIKECIKEKLSLVADKVVGIDVDKKFLSNEKLSQICEEMGFGKTLAASYGFDRAMEHIVEEISEVENPDYVIVPYGSGDGLIGVASGIEKYLKNTKLIAVTCQDPYASKLFTKYNLVDKVIDIFSKKISLQFVSLNRSETEKVYNLTKDILINEPSSAVVFGVFEKISFPANAKIIVVNSGRGLIC